MFYSKSAYFLAKMLKQIKQAMISILEKGAASNCVASLPKNWPKGPSLLPKYQSENYPMAKEEIS